jgi:CHAT domain-containing protein
VRQLPQFESFLRPAAFHQLRHIATGPGGHVVIINASTYGVDALIFSAARQGEIEHVPLLNADTDALSELASDVLFHRPNRASQAQQQSYNSRYLKPALRIVWNDIVVPIFDKMKIQLEDYSGAPQRRIWWYPTGPLTFLPIHAAGPGKGVVDASRLVISSYITTLSSFQSHKKQQNGVIGQPKLLAVSQPDTPGQASLPLSTKEAETVVHVASSAGWSRDGIIHLNGSDATVEGVLSALDSCSWIHFACHGMQHPTLGISSTFALHDGYLELSQIASKRLSSGQFAFLSACHTAAGLRKLPGEAMHLAGGLEFAGFPSVIATMWGLTDQDAPIVAGHTYEYLFRNGLQQCDPSEAAMALNRAVLRLREDPKVTIDRWAPFIHFGI